MEQILTRDSDRTIFVCNAYRGSYSNERSIAEIRRSLKNLSTVNGSCAVIKKHKTGVHAWASRTNGYSLGECFADQYIDLLLTDNDEPKNIIWCEEIASQSTECVMVVIVNGIVEYDAISLSAFDTQTIELLSMQAGAFHVFVYGNVPLVNPNTISNLDSIGFILKEEQVKHFEVLSKSLFNDLQAQECYRFLPIPEAFRRAKLTSRSPAFLAVAMLVMLIYWLWPAQATQKDTSVPPQVVDHYAEYRTALNSAAPSTLITTTLNHLILAQQQHFDITNVLVTPTGMTVKFALHPGTVAQQREQLDHLGWRTVVQNGAILAMRIDTAKNRNVVSIMPYDDVVNALLENAHWGGINLVLGELQTNKYIKRLEVQASLTNSVDQLAYLALILKDLPIVLHRISSSSALGSGSATVDLTIYGNDSSPI